MNLGTLRIGLALTMQAFTKQMQQASNQIAQLGANVNRQLNKQFGAANNSLNQTQKNAHNLGNTLKDVGRITSGIIISQVFYSATSAIQGAAAALVQFNASMETSQVSLKYLLGSQEAANGMLEVIKDFAAVTPYATEEVVKLSRSLMFAGFSPENIMPILTILTDAASVAGGTNEEMGRLVLAISQIMKQGKLAGQEVRQLGEIIPILEILQEELGLTAEQMGSLGDLKIPADIAIAAIFKGLEREFKGATADINNTFQGMWENIKDDVLIESSAMIEVPFAKMKGVMSNFRDYLERGRKALQTHGRGGMFEALVPDGIENQVRILIASLDVFVDAGRNLYKTLKPIFVDFGKVVLTALTIVLPPITRLTERLFAFTAAVIEAAPPVRFLAVALVGLLVGNVVSKTLLLLWRVVRLGAVCTAVATAVNILRTAIWGLLLVLTRNPVVALITLTAGSLLYLTGAAQQAAHWVNQLVNQISSLSNISIKGLLEPKENRTISEWFDKHNVRLKEMDKNLKGVGAAADKAGKKVKDRFVSSFDEIYQIPEALAAVDGGLGGIGTGDDFDLGMDPLDSGPITPELDVPTVNEADWKDLFSDIGLWLSGAIGLALWEAWKWWKERIKKGGGGDGDGGGGGGGVADDIIPVGAFKLNADQIKAVLDEYTKDLAKGKTATQSFSTESASALNTWSPSAQKAFQDVINNVKEMQPTLDAAKNYTLTWSQQTGWTIQEFSTNASSALDKFNSQGVNELRQFSDNSEKRLQEFNQNASKEVNSFSNNAQSTASSMSTGTQGTFTTLWEKLQKQLQTEGTTYNTTWESNLQGVATTASKKTVKIFEPITGLHKEMSSKAFTELPAYEKLWYGMFGNVESDAKQTFEKDMRNPYIIHFDFLKGDVKTWGKGFRTDVWQPFMNGISDSTEKLTTETLPKWWEENQTATEIILGLMPVGFGLKIAKWAPKLKPFFDDFFSTARGWWDEWLSGLGTKVGTAISNAKSSVEDFVKNIKIPEIKIPNVFGKSGALSNAGVPGFATGTIVDRHMIAEVGEGNKREAIIPLENSSYMKPFSAAVASDLLGMLGGGNDLSSSNSGGTDQRTILYVGTLIADDRSLKELDRRMEVIRLEENARKGLI